DPPERRRHGDLLRRGRYREIAARGVNASLAHERRELLGQRAEEPSQLLRSQPEVVVVEERLIHAALALGQAFAVGPGEPDVALERGRERRAVIARPCKPPALLPFGMGLGHLRRELGGHLARSLIVAARDPNDVAVPRAEI